MPETTPTALTWDAPGALWDDPQLSWDSAVGPPPQPGNSKKMAQVKLNLDRLNRAESRELAQTVNDSMDGNANFTTPNPPLADLMTAKDASETADEELAMARNTVTEKQLAAEAANRTLNDLLRQEGSYVQTESGGDEAIILSAGMAVRDEAQPIQMTQVTALDATFGSNGGEVDLHWDPVRGASSYEIQRSPDPITPDSWMHGGISTRSSATLEGLPTGDRCWFRVRAVGANGNGAWSDPATKIVP